jgi:predicted GNAT family acetyltransferase
MNRVTDQPSRQRFELEEESKLAYADYRREANLLVIPYVEAHPALRGRGTAGRLMAGMLEIVRSRGEKVRPLCGYAAAWIQRHPEYHDLIG